MARQQRYCPHCGTVAAPRRAARGSLWIEALFWFGGAGLFLVVPLLGILLVAVGLLYSLWRLAARRRITCSACGADNPIPADSPIARAARSPERDRSLPAAAPAAPTTPRAPADQAVEHRLAGAGGGTFCVLAARQLDESHIKATIARAIRAGRLREPAPGETVTLRLS